jgi:hypothetical protein
MSCSGTYWSFIQRQAVYTGVCDLRPLIVSGGRERTLNGYAGPLARAGVRLEQTFDLPLETTALVAGPV